MAHIITAVIGAGVLSLAWSTSQLGWIGGPVALLCFAIVTYVSSFLLSDCYRSPDPVTGTRNKCYMDAVKVNLNSKRLKTSLFWLFFYVVFNIGYVFLMDWNLWYAFWFSSVIVQVENSPGFVVSFYISACMELVLLMWLPLQPVWGNYPLVMNAVFFILFHPFDIRASMVLCVVGMLFLFCIF